MATNGVKVFLGIDASLTSTGVCLKSGDYVKLFLVKTKPSDFATKEQRIRHISLTIRSKVTEYIPKGSSVKDLMWGIEDYAFNVKSGRIADLAESAGFIKQVMWQTTDKLPIRVSPTTLKKFVTGKGNIGKDQIMMHAHAKWNIMFQNNDVCDAFALATLLEYSTTDPTTMFKYEAECVHSVLDMNVKNKDMVSFPIHKDFVKKHNFHFLD